LTAKPEKTDGKQKTRFKPGQSGNPNGRPKGARNAITIAIEELLDGEAEALTRKAIDLAKAGDMQALRLCMDRLAPARKDRHIMFELPAINSVADSVQASSALLLAVANGEITPSEAAEVGRLIDGFVKAIEVSDIQTRLERLEKTR
jgi:Family of unknown function (DUF5681)